LILITGMIIFLFINKWVKSNIYKKTN
jgi:hypothetical protein